LARTAVDITAVWQYNKHLHTQKGSKMATKYDIQAVLDSITSLQSRRSACIVRYEKFRYAKLSHRMQECLEQMRYINSLMNKQLNHLEKLQQETKELETA
jgi:hypothetical protein